MTKITAAFRNFTKVHKNQINVMLAGKPTRIQKRTPSAQKQTKISEQNLRDTAQGTRNSLNSKVIELCNPNNVLN